MKICGSIFKLDLYSVQCTLYIKSTILRPICILLGGVRYAKSLSIQYLIDIEILHNSLIDIDIDIFENVVIDIDIFKYGLIDIDIFKNGHIDIDTFKKC